MKKKKRKPSKINRAIYIDSDLDARMKKASDVNWSAIASEAFERELRRHDWKTEMGSVIERLKASKSEAISEEQNAGVAAGHEWALQNASYVELRRLSRFMDETVGHVLDMYFETVDGNAFSVAENLAFEICGDHSDRQIATDFWESAIGEDAGDDRESEDYVRGFADGAMKVWNRVSDQL